MTASQGERNAESKPLAALKVLPIQAKAKEKKTVRPHFVTENNGLPGLSIIVRTSTMPLGPFAYGDITHGTLDHDETPKIESPKSNKGDFNSKLKLKKHLGLTLNPCAYQSSHQTKAKYIN